MTGDPHIRFYAGAPLAARDDHLLGTLCVIDREPRTLTENQKTALKILGRQVIANMEQITGGGRRGDESSALGSV